MVGRVSNSAMSLLTLLCRPVDHITHYVIHTCIFVCGSVHRASRYALYVRCDIFLLITPYTYYPVYDVMGTRYTMVLWHIWQRYLWYIYYIYLICFSLTVCHAPRCPPITTPIRFLQLALSWCIFKSIVVNTISSCISFLLKSAYLQQLCSRLTVTLRSLDPLLTSLLDCCGFLLLSV